MEEEDEIYKGIVGNAQDDAIIKEGKGNKDYKEGRFFEGQWKNDKKEGKGIHKYANGDVYEGEFKNNLFEGKGVLKYATGSIYVEEF